MNGVLVLTRVEKDVCIEFRVGNGLGVVWVVLSRLETRVHANVIVLHVLLVVNCECRFRY